MHYAYPSQRLQDWLSQSWVMFRGRQVERRDIAWLDGPFGDVDVIADAYVERLAADEDLVVERNASAGLLPSMRDLLGADVARLDPRVAAFYEHTAEHDLEVWSEWCGAFRPFAVLIHHLYSRRLQQLNLPLRPLDTARGRSSEIIRMHERTTGRLRYTIWFRRLKATGRVIYSGIYMTTTLPDGRRCAKIAFPLPRGNATVVMAPRVDEHGALHLESTGRRFGDAGFYFLLRDAKGAHWAQYIRSFREYITVFADDDGVLRTDHRLTLWKRLALHLHYRIERRSASAPSVGARAAGSVR
jgi:hypothetical protein